MIKIVVLGLASKATYKEISYNGNIKASLLHVLREYNVPIASSCLGEGVCKKCVVNKNVVSCQVSIEKLINRNEKIYIKIDYL